jgi:hypothetical protein
MGKHVHKLSAIDTEKRTAICANCGVVNIKLKRYPKGWRCKKAENKFTSLCSRHKRRKYRSHLGKLCERCGFIPEHKCQLDIHHKDGNHENGSVENLQTLCANCHRYITELSRQSPCA